MLQSLADYLKSIPGILTVIQPELRLAALALILLLLLLLAVLYSGAFNMMSKKARDEAISIILRYGFIGAGLVCFGTLAYGITTFKSEAAELNKSIPRLGPAAQPSGGSVIPIMPPAAIAALSDSLVMLSRQFGAPPGISDALAQLNAGNPTPAITILQSVASRQGDAAARADTLRQIGLLAFYKDTQIAVKAYQESLTLDPNSWHAWSQLAYLLAREGDHASATAAAQKAVSIGSSSQDANALAAGYAALGYIEASAGGADAAEALLEKARGNFLASGSKVEYAAATNNLARLNFSQGNFQTATQLYEEALRYDADADNKRGVAADYVGLAQVFIELRQFDKARDYLDKALAINESIDDLHQTALTLSALGTLYEDKGDLDAAKPYFVRALGLEKQLGNKLPQAYILGSLAKLARLTHNYDEAQTKYIEAIGIAKDVSPFAEAVQQRGIGTLYFEQKKSIAAIDAFRRAVEIDRDLKRKKYLALDLTSLGWVYGSLDQTAEACASWKEAEGILTTIAGAEQLLAAVQKAVADKHCNA